MVGHTDSWVYKGFLNVSSMDATQLGKDVVQTLRDSGLLPILSFPCSAFYQTLVDFFYLHIKGEKNCLTLNGEILGVLICFASHTLVKSFPGLRKEGEAPISEKTYTDGWIVMRGDDSQPNAYDNKKSLYEPIDYTLADIVDRCLLLKSGGHDKITKAQQEIMGAIRLKQRISWSEILFELNRNIVIIVRTNTPLAGRKNELVMMYHILISHFLYHHTTIANNLHNFIATPVELVKVFDVHNIQRASSVANKRGGAITIPTVPRCHKRKAELATNALVEEEKYKPKRISAPKPSFRPSSPKPKPSTRASSRQHHAADISIFVDSGVTEPKPFSKPSKSSK